jgi:hypothetical protein
LIFGWCVFLIHVWAIVNILVVLPSWALRLGLFELLGVSAYPLVFALLESILVWLFLILLGLVLPRKLLGIDFVSQAATVIFVLAIVSGLMHFSVELIFKYRVYTLAFILIIVLTALFLSYLAGRSVKFRNVTRNLLSRVNVLSGIYIFMDLVGLSIIFIRNLSA